MAAAATEIGERPGTMSSSTALRAMCVAALWTMLGRAEMQRMSTTWTPQQQTPQLTKVGAETRHEVSGGNQIHTRLQSLENQFEASANLLLGDFAHSTDFLNTPKSSNEASPLPGPITVDKSDPLRSGFSGPPTRDGSTPDFSLENVRHSEPTSITLK
ncbi:hypothetical protein B566_EDAN005262 [Ephemera danica]|nr:hypothetical protein B566_EDAN005262 [Ephemera danica]